MDSALGKTEVSSLLKYARPSPLRLHLLLTYCIFVDVLSAIASLYLVERGLYVWFGLQPSIIHEDFDPAITIVSLTHFAILVILKLPASIATFRGHYEGNRFYNFAQHALTLFLMTLLMRFIFLCTFIPLSASIRSLCLGFMIMNIAFTSSLMLLSADDLLTVLFTPCHYLWQSKSSPNEGLTDEEASELRIAFISALQRLLPHLLSCLAGACGIIASLFTVPLPKDSTFILEYGWPYCSISWYTYSAVWGSPVALAIALLMTLYQLLRASLGAKPINK